MESIRDNGRYTRKQIATFRRSYLKSLPGNTPEMRKVRSDAIALLIAGPKKEYTAADVAAFRAAKLTDRGYKKKERSYDPIHGKFTPTYEHYQVGDLPMMTLAYGNSKLGKTVAGVSLVPIGTCMRGVPCGNLKGCYAVSSWFLYANTCRPAWRANTSIARYHMDVFEEGIRRMLEKVAHKTELFRWFSSGDFISQEMVTIAIAIADQFPKIPFLAFTKRYDFEFPLPSQMPPNFQLTYSQWPGWTPPRPVPQGAVKAWVQNMPEDKVIRGGREGVRVHDPRVPADAFVCPGQCTSCRFCWNESKHNRDVVFMYH